MPPRGFPAHYDGTNIRADDPVELPADPRLWVTVLPEQDAEREEWLGFSRRSMARCYSDDEPDYSDAKLIWVNPEYVGD